MPVMYCINALIALVIMILVNRVFRRPNLGKGMVVALCFTIMAYLFIFGVSVFEFLHWFVLHAGG